MFCFNVKNRNYCIGNSEFGREKYREIKASLLEQIAGELQAKKELKWDIYNLSF